MSEPFVRPTPGIFPIRYPPATFYPCGAHPGAEAITVLTITETDARHDEPLCAECGRPLLGNWSDRLEGDRPLS